MATVQTVTGPCSPDALGTTLMHEHLLIGWPGWEAYAADERSARRERVARCVDQMAELRELGVRTLLDPCPMDLGRDVELMAEVSERSGVRIVCATGLYKEELGAPAYFKFRTQFGDALAEMTEVFVRELTEGVDGTGIRAGVIKVAIGPHRITPYEELVLRAAARAHRATSAPITTHTDEGTMGMEQLDILTGEGVPPSSIVVGHSCGSSNLDYHLAMLDRGAYLGFDRFGLELLHPEPRAEGGADRAPRGRLRAADRPLARYRLVLARPRPRRAGVSRRRLAADASLPQGHPAPAGRGRPAGEDRRDVGRESAPLLRGGRGGAVLNAGSGLFR